MEEKVPEPAEVLGHLWNIPFDVTENQAVSGPRMFLSAKVLLDTSQSGSRVKCSWWHCLVCMKRSRIEQDQALVRKQMVSVNTFTEHWGLGQFRQSRAVME